MAIDKTHQGQQIEKIFCRIRNPFCRFIRKQPEKTQKIPQIFMSNLMSQLINIFIHPQTIRNTLKFPSFFLIQWSSNWKLSLILENVAIAGAFLWNYWKNSTFFGNSKEMAPNKIGNYTTFGIWTWNLYIFFLCCACSGFICF